MKTSFTLPKLCLAVLLNITALVAWAQKPDIKSMDKVVGSMDETVTLKGAYFGTDATKLAVTFGASKGTIKSVSDQVLVVGVPSGTLYHTIGVTNTANGLTGFSLNQFLLNFRGNSAFDVNNLEGQTNFPSGAPVTEGLYDMCMCDFDGDKKVDVATANDNTNFVNIYPNNSNPGTIQFPTRFAANISSRSLHIKCGDLNGDGKPDLVATESGSSDKVFILKNNSSGIGSFAFSPPTVITLAGKRPKRIEIADLDLDGKPDVVISSQATNTVTVLMNQSTLATISFGPVPPVTVPIPGVDVSSTEGLAVDDLNGDGLPEIVTGEFQTKSDIYIVENKSVPGSFVAGSVKTIVLDKYVKNIRTGDLDGDGKSDIAYTDLINSKLSLLRNQSTTTNIAFAPLQELPTDEAPWGLDFGDIDGDGKADVVVAFVKKKSLTMFLNRSTIGSFSFKDVIKPTTYISRHVVICDADTDGKPDIGFTSIDDNATNVPASKISFFRNKNCMSPQVTPTGPLNVCSGYALELIATKGNGVTYEWTNVTTSTTVTGTEKFTPTVSGDYFVTATSEGGSCKEVSNTVKVTISPGTAADPAPINNGPVCVGQTLNLQISNNLGAGFTYEWSGPDNYTGTGINPAPVTNFQAKHAGIYYVDVRTSGGCIARRESTQVDAVDLPTFKVAVPGSLLICNTDSKLLSVSPNVPGFTFQWFEQTGGAISGATNTTLLRNTTGEYYFQATSSNPGCPVSTSEHVKLTVVAPPTAVFTMPASACRSQEISIDNQSTFDSQATVNYTWTFSDGTSSSEIDPRHIFTNPGSPTVKLDVAYPGNTCGVATLTKSITITAAPDVSIENALNKFELCENATLVLSANATFTSYLWNTGETTSSITIDEPGDYSLEVKATNGCELKAVRTVTALPSPTVTASATPELINEGESVQLQAEGVLDFSWTPTESLSNPTLANPTATPLTSTTYTVSGKDGNGCIGTATIEVKVKGESMVSKLKPSNFFSPNGDAVGQYWMIERIDEFPQCKVTIYDDKGVKVFEAQPYQNNWEGTFTSGKRLPDGVYYYIIRCDGEENIPRTGSITVLR